MNDKQEFERALMAAIETGLSEASAVKYLGILKADPNRSVPLNLAELKVLWQAGQESKASEIKELGVRLRSQKDLARDLGGQIDYRDDEITGLQNEIVRLRAYVERGVTLLQPLAHSAVVAEYREKASAAVLAIPTSDRGGKGYEREVLGQNNEGDTL